MIRGSIPADGQVALEWAPVATTTWLLAIRSGARPGFTAIALDSATRAYRFANLGRHQRYRFAVMTAGTCSPWLSATPRAGYAVLASTDDGDAVLAEHLAAIERLLVMPQDRRLTLYWKLGRGFVDKVLVSLSRDGDELATWELEPEVSSFTIDRGRYRNLTNGSAYTLTVRARFAATASPPTTIVCTPAPQGQERAANRAHPQAPLVYACLSVAPELDVFGDGAIATGGQPIACGRCRGATEWRDYALRCTACRAEYIANLRGDYLDIAKLRFGTCKCCLPKQLLVQDVGSDGLRCAHAGKEHIRGPGGYLLIEDLPFGLCQCCRPRRPLAKTDDHVRCTKSSELHRRSSEGGAFALVPSAPVFDAAAIDELLDAGLADICASGISRRRTP